MRSPRAVGKATPRPGGLARERCDRSYPVDKVWV
jgi:hypothetical protein